MQQRQGGDRKRPRRGPQGGGTLRVFSNWEVMRVIMPSAAMNDSRESTCASPGCW